MKGKSWQLLIVTDDGYGHRFPLRDIPRTKRGTYGVRVQGGGKTLAGAVVVFAEDGVPDAPSDENEPFGHGTGTEAARD